MQHTEQVSEPPSSSRLPIFMIGQDGSGNWVAQEKTGARGGLFTNRAGALKFVKFENGIQPHTVVWVNGVLELNISVASVKPSEVLLSDGLQRAPRAA
jgi:hypothetical protein